MRSLRCVVAALWGRLQGGGKRFCRPLPYHLATAPQTDREGSKTSLPGCVHEVKRASGPGTFWSFSGKSGFLCP
jgi:hypothetical protein